MDIDKNVKMNLIMKGSNFLFYIKKKLNYTFTFGKKRFLKLQNSSLINSGFNFKYKQSIINPLFKKINNPRKGSLDI